MIFMPLKSSYQGESNGMYIVSVASILTELMRVKTLNIFDLTRHLVVLF
jgi:hypothetical protein